MPSLAIKSFFANLCGSPEVQKDLSFAGAALNSPLAWGRLDSYMLQSRRVNHCSWPLNTVNLNQVGPLTRGFWLFNILQVHIRRFNQHQSWVKNYFRIPSSSFSPMDGKYSFLFCLVESAGVKPADMKN